MIKLITEIHSFSDSLSNSSSTTFISHSNQTLDTFKSIVEKLVESYNSEAEIYNIQNKEKEHFWPKTIINESAIWFDIFREPKISEFDITIPEKVRELDRYYNDNDWSNLNSFNWIANRVFDFSELQRKIDEELEKITDKSIIYPKYELKDSNPKLYNKQEKLWSKQNKKVDDLRKKLEKEYYKDWYKYCEEQILAMWQLNCKQNNIKFEDLGKYTFTYWSENVSINFENNNYGSKTPLSSELKNFKDIVYQCDSYNYDIKKGSIILDSAEDNSIPYDLQEKLVEVLNMQRVHLG